MLQDEPMVLSSSPRLQRLVKDSCSISLHLLRPLADILPRGFCALTGDGSSGGSRENRSTFTNSKLFISGLSYDTNEPVLGDAFAKYGKIIEVKVICDRWRGKSRGFGFIQFAKESEATSALKDMDGQVLEGRHIRVRYFANEEASSPREKRNRNLNIVRNDEGT